MRARHLRHVLRTDRAWHHPAMNHWRYGIEGCLHCGVIQQDHAQHWIEGVGFHTWMPPTAKLMARRIRVKYGLEENFEGSGLPTWWPSPSCCQLCSLRVSSVRLQ